MYLIRQLSYERLYARDCNSSEQRRLLLLLIFFSPSVCARSPAGQPLPLLPRGVGLNIVVSIRQMSGSFKPIIILLCVHT